MRKLIIGCGYLGRRVAAAWIEQGDDVWALTRSAARVDEFCAMGLTPIVGDVTAADSLAELPSAETVLYAVGYDRTAGPTMRDVYVTGLQNALAALAGKCGRLIYISSTSVYGQAAGEWIDEDSPTEPAGERGRICLEAEQLVRRFAEGPPAARVNILRLAGIYGPGRLIGRTEKLQAGEPIAGDPHGFLNLIHVDDAVASVLACEQRSKAGETYLVADGHPLTRREFYTQLTQLIGAPPPTFNESAPSRTSGLNKRCSNRKLREELGVTLQYANISNGVRQALTE